ncbi:hypothetical protein [Streptomyces flavofungini]|nr:hypothetical protein [Streptomyces flavofungini]
MLPATDRGRTHHADVPEFPELPYRSPHFPLVIVIAIILGDRRFP